MAFLDFPTPTPPGRQAPKLRQLLQRPRERGPPGFDPWRGLISCAEIILGCCCEIVLEGPPHWLPSTAPADSLRNIVRSDEALATVWLGVLILAEMGDTVAGAPWLVQPPLGGYVRLQIRAATQNILSATTV